MGFFIQGLVEYPLNELIARQMYSSECGNIPARGNQRESKPCGQACPLVFAINTLLHIVHIDLFSNASL